MRIKAFLLCFIALLLFSPLARSQNDYSKFQSIAKPSPFFAPSANGRTGALDITNDYDNFYLGGDFGEPYVASNPTDPLNTVCAYNFDGFYYTLDGFSWTKTTPPFPGFSILGDPVMTYDSLGTIFYSQLYQNGATYGVVVNKSTNKGQSWVQAVSVFSTTVGLCDKEWIAADQTGGPYSNNVYIGWRQFGSSGMRFSRSTNHGLSWDAPTLLNGNQGAYVCVGAHGNISGGCVYYAALASGPIQVCCSTDGGVTFGPQINACAVSGPGVTCAGRNTVKNCIRIDPFPRMAADNSFSATRGNVYVVWCNNPTGPDNSDIMLVRSTDFGTTWSSPVRVNDDPSGILVDQFMPTVSVDNVTGKVIVAWYDSRVDPANNILTRIYGAVSTDGGQTFSANANISDVTFNPNLMVQGQPGGENYIGDYFGISSIKNSGTAMAVWMDGRNSGLASYAGYFPDYAMNVSPSVRFVHNNDSATYTVKIPSIKGPYSGRVRFTAALDTAPTSGTINLSFANGKDSITAFPDSVTLKVKTIGTVNSRLFTINVKGSGPGGVPVHVRPVSIMVNTDFLTIGTNHNGSAQYTVNSATYSAQEQLVFPIGANVSVHAISPHLIGTSTKLIYVSWSDGGDTAHTVNINNNINLTATYKAQFKLIMNSVPGNTFGGNIFYDSAASFTYGVLSKTVIFNNQLYTFHGWAGTGPGSYTSPDSSGADTAITTNMSAVYVETARWTGGPIGIVSNSTELPAIYKLYQNYPNPFNPSTMINFDIVKDGNVKIVIYDILGRVVNVLVNANMQAGKYRVDFNAQNYASGMYFYKITSDKFTDVKKMLILK